MARLTVMCILKPLFFVVNSVVESPPNSKRQIVRLSKNPNMKKTILLLFLFYLSGFCLADNKKDTLNSLSNEYQILNEKIIKLDKDYEKVNGRIDDWYTNFAIGSGIFLVLLGALITIQWFNNMRSCKGTS